MRLRPELPAAGNEQRQQDGEGLIEEQGAEQGGGGRGDALREVLAAAELHLPLPHARVQTEEEACSRQQGLMQQEQVRLPMACTPKWVQGSDAGAVGGQSRACVRKLCADRPRRPPTR